MKSKKVKETKYELLKFNASAPIVQTKQKKDAVMLAYIYSFIAGVINGLFGGGAGMLIVPVFEKFFRLSPKTSHATAVFVVLPLCVFSLILYFIAGKFSLSNGYWAIIGVVLGGAVGALTLKHLKPNLIRLLFSLIVLFTGIKLLIDAVGRII